MRFNRYIPCLLLRDMGLIKTKKFNKYNYIGDPINAVRIFNDKCVDELIFLDIDASKEKRGPNFELIGELASECFMPFAYGGGISTLKEIEKLIQTGVEKVVLNNVLLKNINFLSEAVEYFGSSTIVGGIDVKKDFFGKKMVFNHVTKSLISESPIKRAKLYADMGVGEIFLNNVDLDGVMTGYDLKLINEVSNSVGISIIASGGASSENDLVKAIENGASAAAAGSLFVYQGAHNAVLINYPFDFK